LTWPGGPRLRQNARKTWPTSCVWWRRTRTCWPGCRNRCASASLPTWPG